jgi:hypothetical protein
MQEITVNEKVYNIPISWDDLTYRQGIDVIKHIEEKDIQLSKITGIPLELIHKMSDINVSKLFSLISFTEHLEVFENDEVIEDFKSFDFGSIKYSDAEFCRKILTSESIGFEAVIGIIKHLKNYDISNEPFLKVIGTANFFLSKSIIFMIVMPSSEKVKQVMSKLKQGSSDYQALAALQRMLNLQS